MSKRKPKEKPDLQFCNLGFCISCTPETNRGEEWLQDNLCGEQTSYGGAIMIEPRYLEDIVLGARADGLICHG